MQLPLSWLKKFIQITENREELSELLTLLGLEVDRIEPLALPFEGVVVGEVVATEPHPNADTLQIATLFDGKEQLQVVCGASNCRAGVKFPFAPVGARLGLDQDKPFRIKRAKLRGVESNGMLCSWDELGFKGGSSGIAELPADWTTGELLKERYSDEILEISLTPNLGHCQSALGIAGEIAAATGRKVSFPATGLVEEGPPIDFSVTVEAPDLCPRYACRIIRGVEVGPSPEWLSLILERCGVRSLNNVVDTTNFVMLEMGQPLHAFDLAKLRGEQIVVRRGREGEPFTALDEKSYELSEQMLAICDAEGPIAVGGVIGGGNSEVGEETVDILLEAAHFEPSQVMRTARELGIQTESSKRFERHCDPNAVERALERAASLIQQVAGGKIDKGVIDCAQSDFSKRSIPLRMERVNALLGTKLSRGEIVDLLERLGCELSEDDIVRPPTSRGDLVEEIDLIEEVVRLYGYHNIERVLPRSTSSPLAHAPLFLLHREVQGRLIGAGLQQVVQCNLISPEQVSWLEIPKERVIEVVNPGSQDHSLLRPSLLPGLLQIVRYNLDREERELALFEIGQIHLRTEERFEEESQLAIMMTGEADFFDVKGVIESLLAALGVTEWRTAPSTSLSFHPGRQAKIVAKRLSVGTMGEIHPALLRKVGIDQRVIYAEISLNDLLEGQIKQIKAHTPSPYPSSSRDWTVTLPEALSYAALVDAIEGVSSSLLEEITLLDVYRSDQLGRDVKNVTVRLRYRSPKGTLSIERVEKEHSRVVEETKGNIGSRDER